MSKTDLSVREARCVLVEIAKSNARDYLQFDDGKVKIVVDRNSPNLNAICGITVASVDGETRITALQLRDPVSAIAQLANLPQCTDDD